MKKILLLLLFTVTLCNAQEKEVVFKYFEQFDNQSNLLAEGPINTMMCYNNKEFVFTLSDKKIIHYDITHIGEPDGLDLASTIYTVIRRYDGDPEFIQVFTDPKYGCRVILTDFMSQWFYPQKLK